RQRAGTVTGVSVNIACLLSVMLSPYMPHRQPKPSGISSLPSQMSSHAMLVGSGNFVCTLSAGHRVGTVSTLPQTPAGVGSQVIQSERNSPSGVADNHKTHA
ncbi:unnamed protein product, partial [Tetraodon nigroviridis]